MDLTPYPVSQNVTQRTGENVGDSRMPRHIMTRREWITAAALLPAASLPRAARLLAQQDATFSTGVNIVNVPATVRNGKGEIVRDLTVNDFTLEEDGRPQAIRYFSGETNLPLTLGLLVDVSASQWLVLPEERHASYAFLNQMLREEKNTAFLISFEREMELIKDLTSSNKELESALNSLDAPELRRPREADIPEVVGIRVEGAHAASIYRFAAGGS
jgi:hypothetical protein